MARFKYYNINPEGDKIGDCVVRAISLASGIPYEIIKRKLWLNGQLYDCDCISKFCYSNLIRNVLGYKEVYCEGMTVGEFADLHPRGTYLIRVPNHLTCIIDGVNYDTWSTLDQICDVAWEVG